MGRRHQYIDFGKKLCVLVHKLTQIKEEVAYLPTILLFIPKDEISAIRNPCFRKA